MIVTCLVVFFNWDSLHARLNTYYDASRKRSTKRLRHKENLFRKNRQMSVNSRLKVTKMIGQREAFLRQRIQGLAVRGKKLLT